MDTNTIRLKKLDKKVKLFYVGITVLAYVVAWVLIHFINSPYGNAYLSYIVLFYITFDYVMIRAYFSELPKCEIGFHVKVLIAMIATAFIFMVAFPEAESGKGSNPLVLFAFEIAVVKFTYIADILICNAYVKRCREKGRPAHNVKRLSNISISVVGIVLIVVVNLIFW